MTGTAVAPVSMREELAAAGMLVRSGLTPKEIRTPEAALFCILAGRDLGMSAVQSLRCIRPVQGKLEVSADAQLGLYVQQGGRFQWDEISPTRAALTLMPPWMTTPHQSVFTIEDAKQAGLTGDNWRKYPKAMLRSRAITQGLKDIGFLAGAGVYAPGEIGGAATVTAEGEVVTDGVAVVAAPALPAPAKRPLTEYSDAELQDAFLTFAGNDKARAKIDAEAARRGLVLAEVGDAAEEVDA